MQLTAAKTQHAQNHLAIKTEGAFQLRIMVGGTAQGAGARCGWAKENIKIVIDQIGTIAAVGRAFELQLQPVARLIRECYAGHGDIIEIPVEAAEDRCIGVRRQGVFARAPAQHTQFKLDGDIGAGRGRGLTNLQRRLRAFGVGLNFVCRRVRAPQQRQQDRHCPGPQRCGAHIAAVH